MPGRRRALWSPSAWTFKVVERSLGADRQTLSESSLHMAYADFWLEDQAFRCGRISDRIAGEGALCPSASIVRS
jgi:hypothetical protein